jgi:hypothetical protein
MQTRRVNDADRDAGEAEGEEGPRAEGAAVREPEDILSTSGFRPRGAER